jgi:hypothetical protein
MKGSARSSGRPTRARTRCSGRACVCVCIAALRTLTHLAPRMHRQQTEPTHSSIMSAFMRTCAVWCVLVCMHCQPVTKAHKPS